MDNPRLWSCFASGKPQNHPMRDPEGERFRDLETQFGASSAGGNRAGAVSSDCGKATGSHERGYTS